MTIHEHEEWAWLSAYIDGVLNSDERSRVDSHLKDCTECKLDLEELRHTKSRLAAAPRRAFPPELLANIEQQWTGKSSRPHIWAGAMFSGSRRWVPTGVVALSALLIGLWISFHHTEEELPIEVLAAAHSRYSAEGLIPGDMVASNFSAALEQVHHNNED